MMFEENAQQIKDFPLQPEGRGKGGRPGTEGVGRGSLNQQFLPVRQTLPETGQDPKTEALGGLIQTTEIPERESLETFPVGEILPGGETVKQRRTLGEGTTEGLEIFTVIAEGRKDHGAVYLVGASRGDRELRER